MDETDRQQRTSAQQFSGPDSCTHELTDGSCRCQIKTDTSSSQSKCIDGGGALTESLKLLTVGCCRGLGGGANIFFTCGP